jgi:hypothetical protein
MQIPKCKLQIAFHSLLAALVLLSFPYRANAGTPRDDLLRLVPEDVGFCLVIQDLRGHSNAFLQSPFVKKLWESPIGKAIAEAPEHRKLVEFDAQLKQGLGVTWPQLRDDVFGDAVVFAYRPGSPGKEDQEQGLMLVHAHDAKLLADISERFNDIQKQSGELKDVLDREYRGVKYKSRIEGRGQNFAYLHGPILAFSTREDMIQQVIDLEQKPAKGEPALLSHLRRLGADQALAALWINPRAFDSAFEQKAKQLHGPEASVLQIVQQHWKAVTGIALSARVKESEVELALSVSAQTDLLPTAGKAAFSGEAKPSDLWRAFPDNAMLALGGRLDVAAWNELLSGILPEENRKAIREAARRFAGPALGKKDTADVLPSLGPDWGFCVLAPRPEDKGWFPQTIWALRIQPGSIERALLNAMNSLALLGVFAYNGSHPDQITFHSLEKMEGSYLTNDQEFPAGFQPAFALKDGFFILASSPAAIGRFTLDQAGKSSGANEHSVGSRDADLPLLRLSFTDLAQYLKDHQAALADHIAQKKQISKSDVTPKLEALTEVCRLFKRVDISPRLGSGKMTLALRLQTALPLADASKNR